MINKTNFKDLKIVTNSIHRDNRGYFKEILLEKKIKSKFFKKKRIKRSSFTNFKPSR